MQINCQGKLIDLSTPKVMGILNVTPNSFFDGGKYSDEKSILNQVDKMLNDGATFLDIGAYSSKPNAEFVSEKEEINRIIPVLKLITSHYPEAILSIDTFRSEVAKICLENGASIINDISAGEDDVKMFETIAKYKVPYIMMHKRGNSQTMNSLTNYENIVKEILQFFSEKVTIARGFGINDIIIDPGFGFAKNTEHNYEILQKLELFNFLELPILVGISRKSMIYKQLNITQQEALNGSTVLNTIALTKGAKILRVHDVKEAVETVKLFNFLD